MSAIDDLIAKLPEEMQEWARRYINFLRDSTFEELQAWIRLIAAGNWRAAYEQTTKKMSVEDLTLELRRVNASLEQLNDANAAAIEIQKQLILELLSLLLSLLKAKLE